MTSTNERFAKKEELLHQKMVLEAEMVSLIGLGAFINDVMQIWKFSDPPSPLCQFVTECLVLPKLV